MAASSLASQLQAIQSLAKTESEPQKRPFTRPSILYNPKEAADINLDALLDIALSGVEVLIGTDERFRNYKNDLFSHKSKELDRELLNIEDNKKIDASITSYLRLLSQYFQLPSALKTLEYLIRRYKIHLYNTEELILCALPYHDTHVFVRIVQILNTGNTKWKFLDAVKASGAPPPRNVIVQQCIRDMGVLEALCDYASSTKKFQPSRRTVSFCTVVIVEALGSVPTLESDLIKRVLPYISSGLQLNDRVNSDHKAGALIIVGLLASRVSLSPKLVKSLMRSIAEAARDDAKQSIDLQSSRTSLLALINLVQLQSGVPFPKKAVDILNEIRDIPEMLDGLAKEFNIDKFLAAFIEALLEYGSSDGLCRSTMLSVVDTVPLKHFVDQMVSKLLRSCIKLSYKNKSESSESGIWTKEILESINKNYPSEFLGAVHKFLEDAKVHSEKEGSLQETLCRILDGSSDLSPQITDSKIWFLLEHPKAEVRRSALSRLNAFGVLKENTISLKSLETFQDTILRRLHDDDLAVVQAVVTLNRLEDIINQHALLDALESVLHRCIGLLTSKDSTLPCDVATSCVELALRNFCGQTEFSEQVATSIFPLLLILQKAQRLNLKAIELAKKLSWPFFQSLSTSSIPEKSLEHEQISAYNMDIIRGLAETLVQKPREYVPWLVKCCKFSAMSEVFLLLIVFQSFATNIDFSQFKALYDACYPVLKSKWTELEAAGDKSMKEVNTIIADVDCKGFLDQFLQTKFQTSSFQMNTNILVGIFWKLLQGLISLTKDASLDGDADLCRIQDLYVFFAESQSKHVFHRHLAALLTECITSPVKFLSKLFTEEGVSVSVQIESLQSFVMLCSQSDENLHFELLAEFPSLLVPLASDDQNTRVAAMNCIEGLRLLWRVNSSKWKNGQVTNWSHFVEGFLTTMIQQKRLILSDKHVLPAILTSLLSSSCHSLLVPEKIDPRFTQSTKTSLLVFIIDSAFKLPGYAKLVILSLLKGLGGDLMRIKDVESLLCGLLERRHQFHLQHQNSCHKLTNIDTELLCLLLESCAAPPSGEHVFGDQLLEALWVGETSSEDPALVEPCVTVLRNLSTPLYTVLEIEKQEQIFQHLVFLFRSANAFVQNAAREALLRLNFTGTSVVQVLDFILDHGVSLSGTSKGRKKKKQVTHPTQISQTLCKNTLPFLSSLLDVILLKKDMEDRIVLVVPLFKLLRQIVVDDLVHGDVGEDEENLQTSTVVPQMKSSIYYILQTLLSVLEDISSSLLVNVPLKDDIGNMFDLKLLVECARGSHDGSTRNQVFSLLSTIAKITPEKVFDHIKDICNVIGESAISQWDSHSQRVFELLLSAIVPCWLSKNNSANALLQIFVNILPEVSEHRRLSMMLHLLRNLGEADSLGSLLVLLFRSLVSRTRLSSPDTSIISWDDLTSLIRGEWEFIFAMQICEHSSCKIWLPSLVKLLQQIEVGKSGEEFVMDSLVAMLFTSEKLQDADFAFKLASGEDNIEIQRTLGALLEQVIFHLQFVDSRRKHTILPSVVRKDMKEYMRTVPKIITKRLMPAAFFNAMVMLLRHADKSVQRKALGLLSETVKDFCTAKLKNERRVSTTKLSFWLQLDEGSMDSLGQMCSEIVKLVDGCIDDSDTTLKVAAVSSLEVLAQNFPSNFSIFGACLTSVAKNIQSENLHVSSCCLRAVGALINVLGPRSLSELPSIMQNLLLKANIKSRSLKATATDNAALTTTESKESICMSILGALEAVIDKLSGFLNPYLGDILKLVVLHPKYNTGSNPKLVLKADAVRKLITEKITVRLLLPPLLAIYSEAIKSGDSSVSITFEMLGNLVQTMDRPSVAAHHAKIFDLCLLGLDLRSQRPSSIKSLDVVEKNIINTMISLTMKLTESMFKPLFLRCIDWAESNVDGCGSGESTSINRAISFFSFVNKLTENHRSLFVPYFKYLLDSCVRHLVGAEDAKIAPPRKKKSKLLETSQYTSEWTGSLTFNIWHLRQLILSSLHKCFLYDTGNLKFLDSSNFQTLLKPVISQLVAEPPASVEESGNVPNVEEVDDLLVACLGQMAVTAGTDLLWKPLNHEVLMQSRSEKVRTRLLALRVVKYLVENLKEEYLVLVAETIPFLSELLEDVEPSVKSLAQDILKEMELMSGESLRQYI